MFAATAAELGRLGYLVAQTALTTGSGEPWIDSLLRHVLLVVIFAVIGVAVFALSIWLFCRLAPFSVRKEIEEDQNTALGIIMGSVLLGVSIIIAAAILG